MDIGKLRLAIRERSLLDTYDLSLRFLMMHWKLFAKTAAFWLIPAFVLFLLLTRSSDSKETLRATYFLLPVTAVLELPFTVLASRLVFEPSVGLREVLQRTRSFLLPLLVAEALFAVAITCGLLLFFVPGLVIYFYTSLFPEVLSLEGGSLSASMKRAYALASRNSGEVIAACLLRLATRAFLTVAVASTLGILFEDLLQVSLGNGAHTFFMVAAYLLSIPFSAVARFLVYLDARTRSEGWDIQVHFQDLEAHKESMATNPAANVETA